MALFFDQDWFRERLEDAGQTHDALASAAGLTVEELAAVWKDQMEVTADMVAGFASALGLDPGEVAPRCGVSTPGTEDTPGGPAPASGKGDIQAMLIEGLARLERLEEEVAGLRALITRAIANQPPTPKR